MIVRFLLLALVLAACTPELDVIARYDEWTEFDQSFTPEHEIFRDEKGIMSVRPIVIERGGKRGFGVLTNIRRRVPNAPIIRAIYTGRAKVDYQRHDRLLTHCSDGCQRAEIGVIHMTEESFVLAARTGLPLRVFGRRARYTGVVPPELFQQVLNTLND